MELGPELNRRELLAAVLGITAAGITGCGQADPVPAGELFSPSFELGHRLRDGWQPQPEAGDWRDARVVVVGGGIAGLSAAWRLHHAGIDDFEILELESIAGGTSRSGSSAVSEYPWGAHYVPAPLAGNDSLIRLLREMDVLESVLEDGTPVVREQYLCRDPHERLFADGRWVEGLFPGPDPDESDLSEWDRFRDLVDRFVQWRDEEGRRAFAVPMLSGSDAEEIRQLDQQTMADWLDQHDLQSDRLRWLVDYSCRDDYGMGADRVSAWAGLFYFAARCRHTCREAQPVITWPEGNGRIVQHLAQVAGDRLKCGQAVLSIRRSDAGADGQRGAGVEVVGWDVEQEKVYGVRAEKLVFAAPQFLVPHVIRELPARRREAAAAFRYGAWVVANVELTDRPEENGFPLSWDNVNYDSPSLGYVVATHQPGRDYGPTVWTWYCCYSEPDNSSVRQRLLETPWEDWAQIVLSDLELSHPDIRSLTKRLDVMRWGHAMIQPVPGFVTSEQRVQACKPWGPIHFAGTDLSGIALMEEAQYHGVRAAEEILASWNQSTTAWL